MIGFAHRGAPVAGTRENVFERMRQMNEWGPDGCREHLDEIVTWLKEEAGKRGWWKTAVKIPGASQGIKFMVNWSIRQARKDIEGGGIYVNNARETHSHRGITSSDLLFGKYLLLRKGKRTYVVLTAK